MITVKIKASTLSNPVPQPAHRSIKSAVFVSRFEKEKKSFATLENGKVCLISRERGGQKIENRFFFSPILPTQPRQRSLLSSFLPRIDPT